MTHVYRMGDRDIPGDLGVLFMTNGRLFDIEGGAPSRFLVPLVGSW